MGWHAAAYRVVEIKAVEGFLVKDRHQRNLVCGKGLSHKGNIVKGLTDKSIASYSMLCMLVINYTNPSDLTLMTERKRSKV